uniref:FBD domain-containing protein n=1 Tax=Panagrellus redivivus TaxID=6233 RepID=A0A7E4UYA0_PANRE
RPAVLSLKAYLQYSTRFFETLKLKIQLAYVTSLVVQTQSSNPFDISIFFNTFPRLQSLRYDGIVGKSWMADVLRSQKEKLRSLDIHFSESLGDWTIDELIHFMEVQHYGFNLVIRIGTIQKGNAEMFHNIRNLLRQQFYTDRSLPNSSRSKVIVRSGMNLFIFYLPKNKSIEAIV